jgi:ribosomal protein S14
MPSSRSAPPPDRTAGLAEARISSPLGGAKHNEDMRTGKHSCPHERFLICRESLRPQARSLRLHGPRGEPRSPLTHS